MALKDFDYKQFLIQKGERVALGVAVSLMAMMIIISGLSTALGGHSAASNTKDIKELSDQAANKMKTSNPPPNLGDLPGDLKEVQLEQVDPDLFASRNPYFDKSGEVDRKWRRPTVLMPDDFSAEVVRGAVPVHMLEKDDEGKFRIGILQMQSNAASDASKDKLKREFSSFRKWDKVLQTLPGFNRPGFGQGPGGPGAAGEGMGGRGSARGGGGGGFGGGGPPGFNPAMAGAQNLWNRYRGWSGRSSSMSLKWVSEDELDQLGNARLAQDMLPIRMVVVTGTFPYRKQLEEFRRALRFDSIDALLNDPYAIPEFMGIDVQRREIPSTGEPGPWDDVDILESIRQLRIKAVGLVPEDVELENYGIIVQPNRLVMPRPQLARGNYPDSKLPGVRETIATLQKSNEADLPPPPVAKSRFEGLDPWSMDQPNTPSSTTNAREGAGASEGMGRRRTSGSGQTGAAAGGAARTDAPARAPAAMTAAKSYNPPDKCLLRFLDVTVEPGKTYEYRVKVKVANPSYGKENLAVSKEAAALAVLEAPEWREVTRRVGEDDVPLRVRVSDELMYYATDEKIDRAAPANADRAAVQIHRWLDEVRVNPSDQSSVTRVGDWTVLERILLHRGEYIGKQQEVDVAVWRTTLGRFGLAGHGEDALPRLPNQPRPPRQKGVVVDFATDPVAYQPSILVDFEGGKRSVTTSEGKNITDESPVEMLVLNADGKLIVRDSTKDTQDRQRQERYAAWKRELAPLKARDEGKPNPDDNLFQRGDPAGARRRS